MELLEILFILIIAIVISAIFYFVFGRRGPYGAYWAFLILLFLSGVAGRLWIIPAGPEVGGYAWFPLLFWIFVIAGLISAATPKRYNRVTNNKEEDDSPLDSNRAEIDRRVAEKEMSTMGAFAAFGVFFWIFLSLLLIAILTGSLR